MKTVLRSGLFMALLATAFTDVQAQCAASSILIQNVTPVGTQTPGTCRVSFDLSFEMQNNGGNKFIFLHGWAQSDYPDFFDCVDNEPSGGGAIQPPEGPDLVDAFINLGIDNSGPDPVLLSSYTPDPAFNLNAADSVTSEVLPNGNVFFIIYGVEAVAPVNCGDAFVIAFDFWSSQSAQAQNAQCVSCNILYAVNYFSVSGLANCANLTFAGTITNNANVAINGYTLIYADVNGDGFLAPGVDVLVQDTTNFAIAAGPGTTAPISGVIPPLLINLDLIVVTTLSLPGIEGASQTNVIVSLQCAPLPVTFKSFTATRTSASNVALKWETSTEIDNRGFAIQRHLGDNNWEQITFINSLALDGNSTSELSYVFNDMNLNRGISQYRIKQVDFNGAARYSEIRAVRGYGMNDDVIVYPIPSYDGRVNVVFDNVDGKRDVNLIDMTGRLLRQWKGITNNTLLVDNIRPGIYTLRIQNAQSGEVITRKIVVTSNNTQ
jgi:hypothetical protein